MIKKLLFLVFSLSLSMSSLAQAQNENNILESLSSHEIKALTETAQQITSNLSDEEKTLIEKAAKELMSPEKACDLYFGGPMPPNELTPMRMVVLIAFGVYLIFLYRVYKSRFEKEKGTRV